MEHMADWWLLNDIGWSGFEKKLIGNFSSIAEDPNPHESECSTRHPISHPKSH